MKDFLLYIKNFFKTQTPQKTNRKETDDYNTVQKSKKFDIIIRIISVLGAIIIWLCAVTSGSAVNERMFTHSNFEIKNEGSFLSAAKQSGFNVIIEKENTVSFTLKGRKKLIDKLQENEVFVYVDLESYIETVNTIPNDTEQIIKAEITIEAPRYFQVSNVSVESITIKLIPING